MRITRRRAAATPAGREGNCDICVGPESLSAETDLDIARRKLRQRWELASVLHFLNVFEPVIETKLKLSAEEIEFALIEQDSKLAQLHIALLKGILPVSKTLNNSDAWVTALSRKLAMWWPWVAEGEFPLRGTKGEEISKYKELDPTSRLFILKALCEVRSDQNDVVSYIGDAIKNRTEISAFRKEKLAGDGNGILFWWDGNATIGFRLYKEARDFGLGPKITGKDVRSKFHSQWETLATNLEEFRRVVDNFSSSRDKLEVAVGKAVEADVIPVLEKLRKKKQRELQRQQREIMILNGFRNAGITRSCRSRRPVNYRFDDYDKSIKEAIELTNKRKTSEEHRKEDKQNKGSKRRTLSNGESIPTSNSSEDTGSETEKDSDREVDVNTERDNKMGDHMCSEDSDDENKKNGNKNQESGESQEQNWSVSHNRLAESPAHAVRKNANLSAHS